MYNRETFGLCADEPMTQLPHLVATAVGDSHNTLFPIREVSRLTGVNPVTLRAWERRYGFIVPTRSEGGHRLYSQADIDTVRSLTGWIERGMTVSKAGKILAATRDLNARARAPLTVIDTSGRRAWQDQLFQAVNDFDEPRLNQLYGQVFSLYPLAVLFEEILMPVWRDFAVGYEQLGQISEWLFLDSFLRTRAVQRVQPVAHHLEHHVVLAAMPGACRELEIWVAALLIASPQVRITTLAIGQPLEELGLVCSRIQPDALVLFSNNVPANDTAKRLVRLEQGLCCPMLMAGELAESVQPALQGSAIGCLGSGGVLMQRRLQQFLAGRLDT